MKRRAFIHSGLAAAAALSVRPEPALATVLARRTPRFGAFSAFRRDIEAVTGDGRPVTLAASAIDELRGRMRGPVLLSEDAGYDDARRILNPSFDRYPALIAQPVGAADVMAAVDFARDHGGLLLAVKCGGHSFSGASTCDRGMMIDLSRFRGVRVDPAARRAWVAGGTLLGQVDHETLAHGLVTPLGTVSHTGVGGLVTGGGFGRLSRKYGLSVDNLVAVQVVTADGRLVRASAAENEDLFWGVRGGGGNFGVVTSFEFQLHPFTRQVVAGAIVFPAAIAREALTLFAEWGATVPPELTLGFTLVHPPGGEPGVFVFEVCYAGPPADAERLLAPIRGLGTPLEDSTQVMDYQAVQRSGDVDDPRARAIYLKGGFVPSMPPGLVTAILDGFEAHPGRATLVFSQEGGGAVSRVASDATAFAQRDARMNLLSAVAWPAQRDGSEHVEWLRQYWKGPERFTYGFYVNDLEPDHTAAQIQANYRQNHDRLVAVKNRYDPANLFRLNANVKPTAEQPRVG